VRGRLHAEHVAEHRNANLKPNAGEKSDQHRARQEISEETSLKIRASNRNPAVNSATMPTSAMYFSLAGFAMWDNELEKIAAVAESAATTRWREEPKTANATSGNSTV
jgi:hypothetical protein